MTGDSPACRPTDRRSRRRRLAAAALVCLTVAAVFSVLSVRAAAQVQPLVADLSRHLVQITNTFAGTDVLLFGATDGPGDVVMVVRGPIASHVVRRKDKLGVIWANRESVVFEDVPTFYRVAANRPPAEFARAEILARHQIGAETLDLPVRDEAILDAETVQVFREAFIRLKREQGLYGPLGAAGTDVARIVTLNNQLFRINLYFPANVPVGPYIVEVYLFRDGQVVSAEITPLVISKAGLGADIFQFASTQALAYGVLAVVVAVLAGWLGDLAFRKS